MRALLLLSFAALGFSFTSFAADISIDNQYGAKLAFAVNTLADIIRVENNQIERIGSTDFVPS